MKICSRHDGIVLMDGYAVLCVSAFSLALRPIYCLCLSLTRQDVFFILYTGGFLGKNISITPFAAGATCMGKFVISFQ